MIDAAITHNLLDKRGSWLSFDGQQIGQGRDSAVTELKRNPELAAKLIEKIRATVAGGPAAAAAAKADKAD